MEGRRLFCWLVFNPISLMTSFQALLSFKKFVIHISGLNYIVHLKMDADAFRLTFGAEL